MSLEMDESHLATESLPDAPAKQSFRSYKKKYAKLKIKFELGMRESEELIREELRIEDLSKRIQAQNDQLLEVLMEFNDSTHVAPQRRYDLNAPEDPPELHAQDADRPPPVDDAEKAVAMLRDATADLAANRISVEEYRRLEDAVKRGSAFHPSVQYTALREKHHEQPQKVEEQYAAHGNLEDSLGYLTPEYETEYYLATDARLGDDAAALQASRVPEKPTFAERERELTMRNPASVYNWLRRNQPQLLQDHDNASEKSGSRPSNQRSSKKTQARKEEEHYDDDTVSMDAGPTSNPKSKRKRERDDDAAPKPKGGSSRSRKKKEDGAPNSRRAPKRASGAGAGGDAGGGAGGSGAGA